MKRRLAQVSDEWWFVMWVLVVVVGAEGRSGASEMGHGELARHGENKIPGLRVLSRGFFAVTFALCGNVVLLWKMSTKK
jgi:hypothetical protein